MGNKLLTFNESTVQYLTLKIVKAIPNNTSELVNDSLFSTQSWVTNKIAEALLNGGNVDLSGLATKDDLNKYQPKGNYVTQVPGKLLSSNDYTQEDKTKLSKVNNVTTQLIDTAIADILPDSPVVKPSNYYNKQLTDTRILEEINKINGGSINTDNLATKAELNNKQDILVSGLNIKTINNSNILQAGNLDLVEKSLMATINGKKLYEPGNIVVGGGSGGSITIDGTLNAESPNPVSNSVITKELRKIQGSASIAIFTGGCANWYWKSESLNTIFILDVLKELKTSTLDVNGNYVTVPIGKYEVTNLEPQTNIWWDGEKVIASKLPNKNYHRLFRVYNHTAKVATVYDVFGKICLREKQIDTWLYCELTKRGDDFVNMGDIIPDTYNDGNFIPELTKLFKDYKNLYFPKGVYKMDHLHQDMPKGYFVNVFGDGIDETVFKCWDFEKNAEANNYWSYTFRNMSYKDMTICNMGFQQYSMEDDKIKDRCQFIVENVKFVGSLEHRTSYAMYVTEDNVELNIKHVIFDFVNFPVYSGIWSTANNVIHAEDVLIQGTEKPMVIEGATSGSIRNIHVIGGVTGIFFGCNKFSPLDGFVIEDCFIENIEEESLSFDVYGNDTEKDATVAEISITKKELVPGGEIEHYETNKIKLHFNARRIIGEHPNESYEAWNVEDKDFDYLKKFYVVFGENAGDFAGDVIKIKEVGRDVEGTYMILESTKDPNDLVLLPNTDINNSDSKTSNYRICQISSGFFNCVVRHNIIRGAKWGGIAMFECCYNLLVEGNIIDNCRYGSYMISGIGLSLQVEHQCSGNRIINNIFSGGDGWGFRFDSHALAKGRNNIFTGNIIKDNKGIVLKNLENLVFENNLIIGKNAHIDMEGDVNTTSFGKVYPQVPKPGLHFFNMTTNTDKIWNGTQWV